MSDTILIEQMVRNTLSYNLLSTQMKNGWHFFIYFELLRILKIAGKWVDATLETCFLKEKKTYESFGSQSLNPLANGLLAIFSCVICSKEKKENYVFRGDFVYVWILINHWFDVLKINHFITFGIESKSKRIYRLFSRKRCENEKMKNISKV